MKSWFVLAGMFLVCALLVFAAPHHRRTAGGTRSCTLGEIYLELLGEAYSGLIKGIPSSVPARAAVWVIAVSIASVVAAAFPILFIGLSQWWPWAETRGLLFICGGALAIVGAGANLLVMVVSHMTIGFGAPTGSRDATVFIWIIPAFQALFGLAGILAGSSARFAGWLNQIMN